MHLTFTSSILIKVKVSLSMALKNLGKFFYSLKNLGKVKVSLPIALKNVGKFLYS